MDITCKMKKSLNKMDTCKLILLFLLFVLNGKSFHFFRIGVVLKPTCERRDHGLLRCCDLIPETISNGITRVEIYSLGMFRTEGIDIPIVKGNFTGEGWTQVKSLMLEFPLKPISWSVHIASDGFAGLEKLKALRLSLSKVFFQPLALEPLRQLQLLDLTDCFDIQPGGFYNKLFSNSTFVPHLETLILRNLGLKRDELYDFDETFWSIVSQRPIKYLDIGGMKVKTLDVKSFVDNCNTLQYLNLSSTLIGRIINKDAINNKLCRNLEVINITGTQWGAEYNIVCEPHMSIDFRDKYGQLDVDRASAVLDASTFILNSFCESKVSALYMYNISADIVTNRSWSTKRIYLNQGNLPVVDVSMICTPIKIEIFWFTEMNTEYIRPPSYSCASFIIDLNLSGNRLEVMRQRNASTFNVLFGNFYLLQKLYLKQNGFNDLPPNMFYNNINLRVLDLSGNLFTQIHFRLMHLKKLVRVNLSNNRISTLDAMSLDNLNAFQDSHVNTKTLSLSQNPLKCSKCRDRDSVEWVLQSELLFDQELYCFNGKSKIGISKGALNDVIGDCYRILKITLSTTIPLTLTISILITSYFVYRRRIMRRRIQSVRERLQTSGFVVFLSFSRYDDDFIKRSVCDPMDQELRRLTKIDRPLVCTGDNFRYGFSLHNCIIECLKKCTVFIALVTNSFLQSEFCKGEYDSAVEMKLPIILMIKGNVDKDYMRPHMLEQFMKYPRIHWKENENGRFVLTSSWEHVCGSILQSVDFFKEESRRPHSVCDWFGLWWRTRGEDRHDENIPLLQYT